LGGGLFAGAITLVVSGLVPVHVAFIAVAGLYVITGIIRLNELYTSIDWPVIVLLGAMFPVGAALEQTGATALVADGIITATMGLGVGWVKC
jgi:di/tricarboxylate transporter